jgi:hypothetical protein
MTSKTFDSDGRLISKSLEALANTAERLPMDPDVIWFQAEGRRRISARSRQHVPLDLGVSIGIILACMISLLLVILILPAGSALALFANNILVIGALSFAGIGGGIALLGLQFAGLRSIADLAD